MWHYVQNGKACGPVETEAVRELLQKGAIGLDALVWKKGMAAWVAARSVPELNVPAPAVSPPPIPTMSMPSKAPAKSVETESEDIEHNKVYAVLAYIGILFLVPLLAAPNSKFARYHTNQGIILFLIGFVVWFATLVLLPIPLIHFVAAIVMRLLPAAVFVFIIMGIMHAAEGEYKPLPWIGRYRLLN